MSQRDLLVRLDIEQATLANTLNRMERDGLIKRTKDETDARVQKIWLTPKAVEIRDAAYQSANDQNDVALADLDADERTVFLDMMRRVIGAMKAD